MILMFIGGFITGLGLAMMICRAYPPITRVLNYPSDLMMRARIRAIQDRAVRCEKGVCFYNVQGPDGKFKRVMLPEVR